ncbi:unnamed protein product [Coregonus sp. 'balchen']|nr:unnamed protein product [Coregonus sp. 'balchen']
MSSQETLSPDPSLRQEVQPDSSLDTGAQDADSLHYVALNLINKKNWSTRQRSNMEEEMVYSGIRQ